MCVSSLPYLVGAPRSHSGLVHVPALGTSTRGTNKAPNDLRNQIRRGIEREMPAIDDVYFGFRHVATIRFRLRRVKRRFILTPDHQKARLLLAHPSLPLGVVLDVRAVVEEEVALNFGLAWLVEKIIFIGPQIRIMAFDVWIVP